MTTIPSVDPIADYRPLGDVHDEMMGADRSVREHWSPLVSTYQSLGTAELVRREAEIQQLLEQDGVTYNIADDGGSPVRPWALDPIPFVLTDPEWKRLDTGMTQRAELLDLVLTDLYGERRLLSSGIIPPEMVLSDPQFLRSCDGIRLPGERQLVIFGADIGRGTDGTWVVLGHRTEAPSGASYAHENRRVLSRVFPKLFRQTGVHRLSRYVQALRSALLDAAPTGVEDPSVVVLSPGSLSETAFEHAAIAAQLGYPLVQGADFVIREGRVGLRTVGGWSPVHVILRRVDAGFCDPLALRSNSTLGVPGLVDACRTGTVSVVNTLGSGILENSGLAGVMPVLSKHLLGTDLLLDPVPTWWCGDPSGRSHVLAKLGEFVVRPLSRVAMQHSVDTTRSSAAELDELRRRIEAHPGQWVGQERLTTGSTPALGAHGIEPRPTVLRAFAVAHRGSYLAMPGGLARTATGNTDGLISNRAGATSKDIWVLSNEPESQVEFWSPDRDLANHATIGPLPARAAENLFWLGRYAERAESTVRLIRTVTARCDEFLNTATGPGPSSLNVLLEASTHLTGAYPGFVGADASMFENPNDELFSLVADERRPGSVAHSVRHMFGALDVVRDQLSVDTWLVVGSLQRELKRLRRDADGRGRTDRDDAMTNVLGALLQGLLSLSGLATESMVRDLGWQFMESGRRIERATHVANLVGSTLGTQRSAPVESLVVESVLSAGESIITARRRYRSRAFALTTIDLLLGDPGNPRSLHFQIDRLAESLDELRADRPGGSMSSATQLLAELTGLLASTDSARLGNVDEFGHRPELEAFVFSVRAKLAMISDEIAAASFTRHHSQHTLAGPMEQRVPLDVSGQAT